MIKRGTVVGLTYSLTNGKNEVLDKADANDPFFYLHGYGQLIGALEEQLTGLKAGETKKVSFQPKASDHPMSGETLNFDLQVLSVRDATQDELQHGHAHGPDGHHHH